MVNMLLVCSAGMSTSMLVQRMEEAAKKRELEASIHAIAEANIKNYLNEHEVQIILLGPQVRFLKDKIQSISGDIPVEVIDMDSYGRMDGERVLTSALDKIGGKNG